MSVPSVQTVRPMTQIPIPTEDTTKTNDFFDAVKCFFKEKGKEVAKTLGQFASWADLTGVQLPANVKSVGGFAKNTKNFFSALELPEKLHKFGSAVIDLVNGSNDPVEVTAKRARDAFLEKGTSAVNAGCDTLGLLDVFVPMSIETTKTVGTIGLGSTLVGAGNSAIKNLQEANEIEGFTESKTFRFINLARDVSYVAFAIFGLAAVFTNFVVAPVVMLACLTSGLAFTIGSFFYEKIVDPDRKGLNIPNSVIDNVRKEIAHQRPLVVAPA